MEIITDNIYMNKVKNRNTYQMTLDDDFIVSDSKPDVDKIIRRQGEIIIDEYKIHGEKVDVRGRLKCTLLYISNYENGSLHSIVETLPFNEMINMPNIDNNSVVTVIGELEDLTINIINSRKISIKGLVSLHIKEEEMYGKKAIIEVSKDDKLETRSKSIDLSQMIVNKKDIFRIKEDILLQSSKKNIEEILYYDTCIVNCNTRVLDEKIGIKGDLVVFVVYSSEDDEYECLEKEIPFSGEIELTEANEDMLCDIDVNIAERNISVKPDDDGENRIIDIDITLDLAIKLYQEGTIQVLEDIYSNIQCITPIMDSAEYVKLFLKNNTTFKLSEKVILLEENRDILQVCNSIANVKLDEVSIVKDGISVEGVLEINVLYISNDDSKPLNATDVIIPFSHVIEVKDINEKCEYDIKTHVEQINIIMLSGAEIEIKVAINIDTIVFEKREETIMANINEREFSKEELKNMKSMVGYLVKDGDSLWSVAKRFYTTVDMLKEINKIVDRDIKKGDRLLIVREN